MFRQACAVRFKAVASACLASVMLAIAMLGVSVPSFASDPAVKDVRVGVHPEKTRFVIELDRSVPYQIFTLSDPYRVVIDLPAFNWEAGSPPQNMSTGFVTGYRYGLFRPGVSRVVVDLSVPVKVAKHFVLPPSEGAGYRLVIDLSNVEAQQFAASSAPIESDGWKAYAAPLSPRLEPSEKAAKMEKAKEGKRVIALDPGHGGVDPGAIGATGTYEKNVTLAMARAVKKELEASGRYKVVLTRSKDIYIPLRDRYQIAYEAGADIFISLHADISKSRSTRGLSLYTLSDKASDREAELLAAKENKADVIAGADLSEYAPEVSSILIDLAQNSTNENSWHFAEMLVGELGKRVNVLRNTHRFAGFAVLKSPNVPSVLIELGYLSNRHDEKLLQTDKYRTYIGKSILTTLDEYFKRQERLSRS